DVPQRLAAADLVHDEILLGPLREERLHTPAELLRSRRVEADVKMILVMARVLDQRVVPSGEDAIDEVAILALRQRPGAQNILYAAVDEDHLHVRLRDQRLDQRPVARRIHQLLAPDAAPRDVVVLVEE